MGLDPLRGTGRDNGYLAEAPQTTKPECCARRSVAGLGWGPPVTISCSLKVRKLRRPTSRASCGNIQILLLADVIVLADCSNWTLGTPALTTSLRGFRLRRSPHPRSRRSQWRLRRPCTRRSDGSMPADRITSRRPGKRHDRRTALRTAVRHRGQRGGYPPVRRRTAQRLAHGHRTLAHRLWGRPAVAVLGIDAPPTAGAANKLVPVARAKISVRLAPGDDTARAKAAIEERLLSPARAPWGAEVTVSFFNEGAPHLIDASGGSFEAFHQACAHTWGCAPVKAGQRRLTSAGCRASRHLPEGGVAARRGSRTRKAGRTARTKAFIWPNWRSAASTRPS